MKFPIAAILNQNIGLFVDLTNMLEAELILITLYTNLQFRIQQKESFSIRTDGAKMNIRMRNVHTNGHFLNRANVMMISDSVIPLQC